MEIRVQAVHRGFKEGCLAVAMAIGTGEPVADIIREGGKFVGSVYGPHGAWMAGFSGDSARQVYRATVSILKRDALPRRWLREREDCPAGQHGTLVSVGGSHYCFQCGVELDPWTGQEVRQ